MLSTYSRLLTIRSIAAPKARENRFNKKNIITFFIYGSKIITAEENIMFKNAFVS